MAEQHRSNMLRRLSLLGKQSDSDLREFWMPDDRCKQCAACEAPFTLLRRRHHCRICGQIFCSKCCSETISAKVIGKIGELRCCKECLAVYQSRQNKLEEASALPELAGRTTQQPLQPEAIKDSRPAKPLNLRTSGFLSSSHLESSTLKSCVEAVRRAAVHGLLVLKTHRDAHGVYAECFSASELIDVLMAEGYIRRRVQGVGLGQELLDQGYFEGVRREEHPQTFRDETDSLFRLTRQIFVVSSDGDPAPPVKTPDSIGPADPEWLKSIGDDPVASTAAPSIPEQPNENPPQTPKHDQTPPSEGDFLRSPSFSEANRRLVDSFRMGRTSLRTKSRRLQPDQLVTHVFPEALEDPFTVKLHASANAHLLSFIDQCLQEQRLGQNWRPVLLRLLRDVYLHIRPSLRGARDNMDVRSYVKIRCIPEGNITDCKFYHGILFTKNVVHKDMMKTLRNPKILFLRFPIEFQRGTDYKLVSLEVLEEQELAYLKNFVGKLVSCHPDIIMVQRTVSRRAQELLLEKKVTLMINVKESVMDYAARLTQGEVLTSFDQIREKALGTCGEFRLQRFLFSDGSGKTLSCLDGCQPSLGCTVVLRGASRDELSRVKRVFRFLAYVTHSLRLEMAFLDTEGAVKNDELAAANLAARLAPGTTEQSVQFNNILLSMVLTTSPGVRIPLPFLYTADGEICPSRRFIPQIIFNSSRLSLPPPLLIPTTAAVVGSGSGSGSGAVVVANGDVPSLSTLSPLSNTTGSSTSMVVVNGTVDESRDCFIAANHQGIDVLFTFSAETRTLPCQPPTLLAMKYYGNGDLPLGVFLEQQLANEIRCPNSACSEPFAAHYRTYVHHRGCVTVRISSVASTTAGAACPTQSATNAPPTQATTSTSSSNLNPTLVTTQREGEATGLLMGTRCDACESTSLLEAVDPDTWDMSLAKFLELSFYAHDYVHRQTTCSHALHKDLVRVFIKGSRLVTVEYKPIILLELCLPTIPLPHRDISSTVAQLEELDELANMSRCIVEEGTERVQMLEAQEVADGASAENVRRAICDLRTRIFTEHQDVMNKIEGARKLVSIFLSQSQSDAKDVPYDRLQIDAKTTMDVQRASFEIRQRLQLFLAQWHQSQLDVAAQLTSRRRNRPSTLSPTISSPVPPFTSTVSSPTLASVTTSSNTSAASLVGQGNSGGSSSGAVVSSPLATASSSTSSAQMMGSSVTSPIAMPSSAAAAAIVASSTAVSAAGTPTMMPSLPPSQSSTTTLTNIPPMPPLPPLQLGTPVPATSLATTSSPTTGEERNATASGVPVLILSSDSALAINNAANTTSDTVSITPSTINGVAGWGGIGMLGGAGAGAGAGVDAGRLSLGGMSVGGMSGGGGGPDAGRLSLGGISAGGDDSENGSTVLATDETAALQRRGDKKSHHYRSASTASEIEVEQPGTTAAGSILGGSAAEKEKTSAPTKRFGLIAGGFTPKPLTIQFKSVDHHSISQQSTPPSQMYISVYEDQPSSIIAFALNSKEYATFIETPQPKAEDGTPMSHFQMQFHEKIQEKGTDFYCQAFFAKEFRELRRLLMPKDAQTYMWEEGFLSSLASSARWTVNGGKSGALFSKTTDQRFVIKQMSRAEATSVVEFIPHYISYAKRCVKEGAPTALAKVVGVFRIGFKNALTGSAMRQDVIVLENLFFGREIKRIFDLKGSMRSRYAQKNNEVLLDQNLLETLQTNPIFLMPHSKVVLDRAIRNDTDFLAASDIMDYSLLVGIDDERKELVVGIIDYIRTFTWDKRLEMYVKSSGILGGANAELAGSAGMFGAMPTVVSPNVYKTRFTEAMNRYFLQVPNKWNALATL